jgi:hypothetical protein
LIHTPEPEGKDRGLCVYFSGVGNTMKSLKMIVNTLGTRYGPENVIAFPSKVTPDFPIAEMFDKITQRCAEQIIAGKPLTIINNSSGAATLGDLIGAMKKKFPDIDNSFSNIRLVCISPGGFFPGVSEGFVRAGKIIIDFFKMYVAYRVSSLERVVDSFALIPPNQDVLNIEDVTAGITQVFPGHSKYYPGFSSVHLSHNERTDYRHLLSDELSREIDKIDSLINQAHQERDWKQLRRLLFERGNKLAKMIEGAYTGDVFEKKEINKETTQESIFNINLQVMFGLGHLMNQILRGQPYKTIQMLRERGADVRFFFPDHDTLVSLRDIAKFFGIKKQESLEKLHPYVLFLEPLSTHGGHMFQSEILIKALKAMSW